MNEFMTAISLNHECIRVKKKKVESSENAQTSNANVKFYQGTSPDEITLVSFAKECGFEFRYSTDHFAKLRIPRRADDLLLDQ